jgi:LmbE family N-acetylglucosaminyl deacetylase
MSDHLRLMCVLAHPDDESLGTGGILAKYSAEGVETSLVCATRGERGWTGNREDYPGKSAFGKQREEELCSAADILGIREVNFLDYLDGELDQADPSEAIHKICSHIIRFLPHVVVTFDPFGSYGHPDHIAISQLTLAACIAAAALPGQSKRNGHHQVQKLYYLADSQFLFSAYTTLFGNIVMQVDGTNREPVPWVDWSITTEIDTAAYWPIVHQAISCHVSQIKTPDLFDQYNAEVWGRQTYYRAYSLVNGGRKLETDLFEGLR